MPILDTLLWVERRKLLLGMEEYLMEKLTVVPSSYSGNVNPEDDEDLPEAEPIRQYKIKGNLIGLPPHFGLSMLPKMGIKRSSVVENFKNTKRTFATVAIPTPREDQGTFFSDMLNAVTENSACLIQAQTGVGKTVASLYTLACFGRPMLVIVPSKKLQEQWRDEAKLHLGLTDLDIGYVGGDKPFSYKHRKLVIGVVHSVAQAALPDDFFTYFYLALWDEVHRVGAFYFARSLGRVSAPKRIGLTASPRRKDRCEALFLNFFGKPAVIATAKAIPCECRVVEYRPTPRYKNWVFLTNRSLIINALVKDPQRNKLIVDAVFAAWKKGRNILVFSDRIQQLQLLQKMCDSLGIPEEDMGLFTGSYYDGNGKSKPLASSIQDHVKQNCCVIFTTYAMMKEGIDIPRMDTAIEATPIGDAEQAVGRIRRVYKNKKFALWISFVDLDFSTLIRSAMARFKSMVNCGVEVSD